MKRWTDGKSWSASRVSGSFLTYREMEGKRGGSLPAGSTPVPKRPAQRSPEDSANGDSEDPEGIEGPDGYRYKPGEFHLSRFLRLRSHILTIS